MRPVVIERGESRWRQIVRLTAASTSFTAVCDACRSDARRDRRAASTPGSDDVAGRPSTAPIVEADGIVPAAGRRPLGAAVERSTSEPCRQPQPGCAVHCATCLRPSIVGAQWGDEGKGKIVDLLAQDSDVVCRYQGGPNAGPHDRRRRRDVQDPRSSRAAIVRGKPCVIGNGCVVDPEVLIGELDEFEARGHSTARGATSPATRT